MATETRPKNRGRNRSGKSSAPASDSRSRAPEVPAAADGHPAAVRAAGSAFSARPRRREVARRIRDAAEIAASWPARTRLRRLHDCVQKGAGDPQRAQFVEAAIGECLDEAASRSDADRWLACEAATWALGWMARSTRAGGSAGRLLERLAQEAGSAVPLLEQGETLPAGFVFALARLFADVEACRRFEAVATTAVAAEIERLVSAHGTVKVGGSGPMVERVVRWCRFRDLAQRTGGPAWEAATERLWREAATGAVRLLGAKGRQVTTAGLMPPRFTAPLLAAVARLGTRGKRTVAAVTEPRKRTGATRRLLRCDLHDAAVAVFRSGWERSAVRVLVDYRQPLPHLEIAVAERLLVAGPWKWSLAEDGRPLGAEGPWTVSCWESDRNAAFLEITAPLSGGRQLERQAVLLRRDRILILADAVTAPEATPAAVHGGNGVGAPLGGLRYSASLPLAAGLEAEPAAETREILAFDTAMRFQVLPLVLPEWRTAGRGAFSCGPEGLEIVHEPAGRRFYCPLWLDLDPSRIGKPLTWRQLTVADTRIILPPHQAAGFRVQAGREQWLLYRALDAPRNRTLLGCNVSCEFLLGRIKRDGSVRRSLEIQ